MKPLRSSNLGAMAHILASAIVEDPHISDGPITFRAEDGQICGLINETESKKWSEALDAEAEKELDDVDRERRLCDQFKKATGQTVSRVMVLNASPSELSVFPEHDLAGMLYNYAPESKKPNQPFYAKFDKRKKSKKERRKK